MLSGLLFILSLQFGVWYGIIRKAQELPFPTSADVVMVYTGEGGRIEEGMRLAQELKPAWFFVSLTSIQEMNYHRVAKVLGATRVEADFTARTTDGNARAAAAFLRGRGIRRVVLVSSWFHLPRAYLLTRMYLAGSGIRLRVHAAAPAPRRFILRGVFWQEYLKFYGSLCRIVLHAMRVRSE